MTRFFLFLLCFWVGGTHAQDRSFSDADGDGLDDRYELEIGSDPDDDDSDDDGLLDGYEVAVCTSPNRSDSDDDGLLDGYELGLRAPQGIGTDGDGFEPAPEDWAPDDDGPADCYEPRRRALLDRVLERDAKQWVIVALALPFTRVGDLSELEAEAQTESYTTYKQGLMARLSRPGADAHGPNVPPHQMFDHIPYMAMEVDFSQMVQLFREPLVRDLDLDQMSRPSVGQTTALIGTPATHTAGWDGAGRTIAILDTGVEATHAALNNSVVWEACFLDGHSQGDCPNGTSGPGAGQAVPCTSHQDCDHGTHVAGIAAGDGGLGVRGAAPGANIIAIQLFAGGPPTVADSDAIAALNWLLGMTQAFDIAAANLSFGRGAFVSAATCEASVNSEAFAAIAQNLHSLGTAVVVASGNDSQANGAEWPSCVEPAISVGQTGRDTRVTESWAEFAGDRIVERSDSYPNLDLVAPGENVVSAGVNNTVATKSGTSMAAPLVAGAFAVMSERFPTWSTDAILARLVSSGLPRVDDKQNRVTPRIQLDRAVELPGIRYRAHVRNDGWREWQMNGRIAGTTGEGRRAEAVQIDLSNVPGGVGVRYRVRVKNQGFTAWQTNGNTAGTIGQHKRIEQLQVELTNAPVDLGVQYRVHVGNQGWSAWGWDGTILGQVGRRIEAVQVRLGVPPPPPPIQIQYRAHVQGIGWMPWVSTGFSGTVGQNKRMEAVQISLVNPPAGTQVEYRAHVRGLGWLGWVQNGATAGVVGQNRRMEAVQVRLINPPNGEDIEYRAHVRGLGWLGWVLNGATAGTTNQNRRMEAVEVRVLP